MAPGQTLQPTALVHEAYLRVVGTQDPGWDWRGHFFAAAARAMREIVVEQSRRKKALKHGGGRQRIPCEVAEPAIQQPSDETLAVHEAIQRLEQDDPRKGQIVNMRYFARLTTEEAAQALGVSVGTVEREWRYIKAWLRRELAADEGP
jgi:RNA polymerase sigma factor (TIGR02999 family)